MTRAADMSVSLARLQRVQDGWKNLAKPRTDQKAARKWFADLLWCAFPAASNSELSQRAARVLGVSPRTVGNWLTCQNDVPGPVLVKVMLIASAEIAFQRLEGRK